MKYEGMTDAELDAAIADTSVRFAAMWHEKQRRGSQPASPSTAIERFITRHRNLFVLVVTFVTLLLGSQVMRLFK